MNYKIITDEQKLKDFINWLPDLEEDETYYVCLFARSKYVKDKKINHINSDKAQLKRFTTHKDRLFDKLRQLECPEGSYKQKLNVVPQETLAVYINPNPRSNTKAARNALIRLAHLVTGENHGYNLHQEMISEVQKAKSRSCFVDFDFDDVRFEGYVREEIIRSLSENCFHILNTRGGFHVLVDPSKVEFELKNKWYNQITSLQRCFSSDKENRGDNMIPIPGCTQGGFTPHFIDLNQI